LEAKLEPIDWSEEQKADPNKLHVVRNLFFRSVAINDRFYVFNNLDPMNQNCVMVVDPTLRMTFDIKLYGFAQENKPKHARINYSVAAERGKIYIYGGLSSDNTVLDSMDSFDVTTYQFVEVI